MDRQIRQIIERCKAGHLVEITEESLMQHFPDMTACPNDKRRAMREGMNKWLDRTEELFGIEWVKINDIDEPVSYVFRSLAK